MNSINSFVRKVVTGTLSEADALVKLQALRRRGILNDAGLEEALRAILGGQPPVGAQEVLLTARLVASLLRKEGDKETAFKVLFDVANSLKERRQGDATAAAITLYREAAGCFPEHSAEAAACRMYEANARVTLAELGIEPKANLEAAIQLYGTAAQCFGVGTPGSGGCQMNEANARVTLAELGLEPKANLEAAIQLYGAAAKCFGVGTPGSRLCQVHEATARQNLAELGLEPKANLEAAIQLYGAAAKCFGKGTPSSGLCQMNEANARQRLAELGIEPEANLEAAIQLHGEAAKCFGVGTPDSSRCQMNEANARQRLAELGIEPEANLEAAIQLHGAAAKCFGKGTPDSGCCQMNEANVRQRLAELGIEPKANLDAAIQLYGEAAKCFGVGIPSSGRCQMNEATARQRLAELGIEPKANLEAAIQLNGEAAKCFGVGTPSSGSCQMNEANARLRLAELCIEPEANLEAAIQLYGEAAKCFGVGTPSSGRCQMNEATARLRLAELGIEPKANLEAAIQLYGAAAKCFGVGTPGSGHCQVNEANARLTLGAELGIEPRANLETAEKRYLEARSCFVPGSLDHTNLQRGLARLLYRQARHAEAHEVLKEALAAVEKVSQSFRDQASRRSFRETVRKTYRLMVTVCLELAAAETNPEQVEALRWEAWQWVKRSKARTLQENLAVLREASIEHDPQLVAEFEAVLEEFSRYDRMLGDEGMSGNRDSQQVQREESIAPQERVNAVLRRVSPSAGTEAPQIDVPAHELQFRSLAGLATADRQAVVVEFFTAEEGRLGAFVHPAGEARGLRPPLWFPGGLAKATELACACFEATSTLTQDSSSRARRGGQARQTLPPSAFARARRRLEEVASDLGKLLAPLRELIEQEGWADAMLVLCPTGVLHYLPLAAAHWGGTVSTEDAKVPRCLIDAHVLLHLPTAALAVEVTQRERPLTRTAFIAAADPFAKLEGIYEEAEGCAQALSAKGFAVKRVEGEQAIARSLREHGPEAWIVHLAMHTGSSAHFEFCGVEFHDRRLLVLELLTWVRLHKAALAIVATCSSSQPRDLAADDPAALTWAWMVAGAASVIGGLWPLGDESARQFFKAFYKHWSVPGTSIAEAVRAAILRVRYLSNGELFEWAPFLLVGSGTTQLE